MKPLTVFDLFSGIGGFSLGLERTGGFQTIGFCEVDPFCKHVLRKHWPHIPIEHTISRLGKFDKKTDVICGGFPCQPFSSASHGQITAVDLWPEMFRVISVNKPAWVIAENVKKSPIHKAKKDLESLNYNVWTKCISAAQAGADHQRNRWWLCAHTNNESQFHSSLNAEVALLPELCKGIWGSENYSRAVRVSNGVSNRVDRLKTLGNTVLPQIPQIIGLGILQSLK